MKGKVMESPFFVLQIPRSEISFSTLIGNIIECQQEGNIALMQRVIWEDIATSEEWVEYKRYHISVETKCSPYCWFCLNGMHIGDLEIRARTTTWLISIKPPDLHFNKTAWNAVNGYKFTPIQQGMITDQHSAKLQEWQTMVFLPYKARIQVAIGDIITDVSASLPYDAQNRGASIRKRVQRGPTQSTLDGVEKLRKLRQDSIRKEGKALPFNTACERTPISPSVVRRHYPDLRRRWKDVHYDTEEEN